MTQDQPIAEQVQEIAQSISSLARRFSPETAKDILSILEWMKWEDKIENIMAKTGWWPYEGIEEYLLDVGDDMTLASQRCEQFHDTEWPKIRRQMEAQVAHCAVDEESRAAFRECLKAHNSGLYRCVCRCLLVEIERALRVKVNDMTPKFNFEKELENYVNQGELQDLLAGNSYGFRLFKPLKKTLFKQVKSAADCRKMGTALNRHAGTHGLILYNTKQQNFNALVLAFYFFLSSRVKSVRLRSLRSEEPTGGGTKEPAFIVRTVGSQISA